MLLITGSTRTRYVLILTRTSTTLLLLPVPGPPEQVKALAMSSDSILVTWTRPLETNGNIAKYLVYMRPSQPQGLGNKVSAVLG